MRLESSTEYAVIEMGMSHAGEIDRLARAARPDVGIITCIGVSHIGNLGVRRTSARQSWRSATACRRVHRWC